MVARVEHFIVSRNLDKLYRSEGWRNVVGHGAKLYGETITVRNKEIIEKVKISEQFESESINREANLGGCVQECRQQTPELRPSEP